MAPFLSSQVHTEGSIRRRRLGEPGPGEITEPAQMHACSDMRLGISQKYSPFGQVGGGHKVPADQVGRETSDAASCVSTNTRGLSSPTAAAAIMAAFTWVGVYVGYF